MTDTPFSYDACIPWRDGKEILQKEVEWRPWRGKRDSWLDDDPGMSAFWRGRAEAACAILAALRKGADHV